MSRCILHIDDEESVRAMLSELLTEYGYRVFSVATLAEALEAITATTPDLIISDLQLEEADGLHTVAELRRRLPAVPVMILTGVLIDPKVARTTLGPLGASYFEKTQPLSELLTEIRRLAGPARENPGAGGTS